MSLNGSFRYSQLSVSCAIDITIEVEVEVLLFYVLLRYRVFPHMA